MSMTSSSWTPSEVSEREVKSRHSSRNILKWLALGLEALGGALVIAVAVYLRIANLHPDISMLNWREICSDVRLYSLEPTADYSLSFYIVVIAVPIIFIILGEMEYLVYSGSARLNSTSKVGGFHRNLPRMGRIIAMFIVGVMLASFSADYLRILVIQPRPYFLYLFGGNCPSAFNGPVTEEFYNALKSFPSHLACVAGFSCSFAIGYVHKVRGSQNPSVLLPIVSQGFLVLAVTISVARYTSHFNHVVDILAGLLIGTVHAIYMCILVSYIVRPKTPAEEDESTPNLLDFMIPRVALPPTKTAEATNFRNLRPISPSV